MLGKFFIGLCSTVNIVLHFGNCLHEARSNPYTRLVQQTRPASDVFTLSRAAMRFILM